MTIAIDGPVASGKGTVSKLVAKRLGMTYVDSGALFRSVAVYVTRRKVHPDEEQVCALLSTVPPKMDYRHSSGTKENERSYAVILNGKDVTQETRSEAIDQLTSVIAEYLCVRDFLLPIQRRFSQKSDVVMEGRDIGTFVFPEADLKIFLTGAEEVRAQRRYRQRLGRGEDVNFEEVLSQLRVRDQQDSQRAVRPLRKAKDAVEIDTTHLSIDEVVERIVELGKKLLR